MAKILYFSTLADRLGKTPRRIIETEIVIAGERGHVRSDRG